MIHRKIACWLGQDKGHVYSVRNIARRFKIDDKKAMALLKVMPNVIKVTYGFRSLWGWKVDVVAA